MKTADQLYWEVVNRMWPNGAPENLAQANTENPTIRAPYRLAFDETLAEIAKHVECERTRNVNSWDFDKTFFSSGMTVVPAPRGLIYRVWTIANDNQDDPVLYRQTRWPEPQDQARNRIVQWVNPVNAGVTPALPLGFKKAEATTDRDNQGNVVGRARQGIWAEYDENIYVYPWLQSNERLYVRWRGIKTTWGPNDLVTEDQDYVKAVYLHMKYIHERDYGDPARAPQYHQRLASGQFVGTFDEALADLIAECDRRKRVREVRQSDAERSRLPTELDDDKLP